MLTTDHLNEMANEAGPNRAAVYAAGSMLMTAERRIVSTIDDIRQGLDLIEQRLVRGGLISDSTVSPSVVADLWRAVERRSAVLAELGRLGVDMKQF